MDVQNYKNFLEGGILPSSFAIWFVEGDNFIKAMMRLKKKGEKYKAYVKRKYPDQYEAIAMEYVFSQKGLSGTISSIRKGTSTTKIQLADGNVIAPELLKDVVIAEEIVVTKDPMSKK